MNIKDIRAAAAFLLLVFTSVFVKAEPVKFYTSLHPRTAVFDSFGSRENLTVTDTTVLGGQGQEPRISFYQTDYTGGVSTFPIKNIFLWKESFCSTFFICNMTNFHTFTLSGETLPFEKNSDGTHRMPYIRLRNLYVNKLSTAASTNYINAKRAEADAQLRFGTESSYIPFPSANNKKIKWQKLTYEKPAGGSAQGYFMVLTNENN